MTALGMLGFEMLLEWVGAAGCKQIQALATYFSRRSKPGLMSPGTVLAPLT